MLPAKKAEAKLLASIQTPKDLTYLIREGISEDSFAEYPQVFSHYMKFARLYGDLPKPTDVEAEFRDTGIQLPEGGQLDYYVDEVRNLAVVRKANVAIMDRLGIGGAKLQMRPEETVRLLVEDLRKLQRVSMRHMAWLDRDALVRLGWLQDKAQAVADGGVLGIPTGLNCFDSNLQGWQAGEAIMVMAPKGTGKSWLALYIATVGYKAGYKAMFISPEMSWEECALRFDVLAAYQDGVHLSHSALTTGQQDEGVYEDWLAGLTRRDQFVVIDSPESGSFTTENVLALIDEHRPDLVVFDGLHLIGSNSNVPGWERIKHASDALKALAQRLKCTIVWTSQVDRAGMKNPTEPASSGASAAYGKAAVEAANRLVTLANDKNDDKRKTFKVPNNRSGREFHSTQHLHFDVDIGAIYQVYDDYGTVGDEEYPG